MNEIFLQNGKKIWLAVQSLRKFSIRTNHSNVKIVRSENGDFQEMKFSDLLSFKKGDKITIKDTITENYITFILNDISRISDTKYEGIEEKVNMTGIFILPFLNHNHVYYDYGYSLYNAYLSKDYEFIYLKYKFTKSDRYLNLEEKLQTHSQYQEFFDVDKKFVVFKFKLKKDYLSDISLIMEGRYSSIRKSSKVRILNFHGMSINSKLGSVLFKDIKYKKRLELKLEVKLPNDMDLMSKGFKEQEIWNYQNTFQKIGTES